MKKPFDCVEMKRKGQERIQRETKDMSPEQLLAYWARAEDDLRKRQDRPAKASRKPA